MDNKTELKKPKYALARLTELYIWIFAALLTILPAIVFSFRIGALGADFIVNFYNQFLVSIFIVLVPILFSLIFGKLPFEYLRNLRNSKEDIKIVGNHNHVVIEGKNKENQQSNYIEDFISESRDISEKIFSRSGVYLLVGCLIAFIGVAIFYSPFFITTPSLDISQRLIDYMPRFGALFFIEFIAFFFLKQYRIMLEEYRYYEAIKRKRQDNFSFIELIEKYKASPELLKIIVDKFNQSTITKLANGETTEILETQKIVNQDMDIFSKFTDLIKEIKSK
jgi:hypothetical protein